MSERRSERKPAIVARDLSRAYRTGKKEVRALDGVSFRIARGDFVAVSGPSGSGKSTLLHIIGGLDTPTEGSVTAFGQRLDRMSPDGLAAFRRERAGFVFQFFNLIPGLSAAQNVAVSRIFSGGDPLPRARELLERVGLGGREDHLPSELSGGEMQRVAVARALMNDPPLLLADEPTGNLDSTTGGHIVELFRELNSDGRTVVMVTHDASVARIAGRHLRLRDGRLEGPAGVKGE